MFAAIVMKWHSSNHLKFEDNIYVRMRNKWSLYSTLCLVIQQMSKYVVSWVILSKSKPKSWLSQPAFSAPCCQEADSAWSLWETSDFSECAIRDAMPYGIVLSCLLESFLCSRDRKAGKAEVLTLIKKIKQEYTKRITSSKVLQTEGTQPGRGGRQTNMAAQRRRVVCLLWPGNSRDRAAPS